MTGIRRFGLAFALALLAAGLFASRSTNAATLSATWSMYGRADASSFAPGPAPIAATGYEIITFDAVPVSQSPGSYVYGGADLPVSLGGPMAPLVTCEASFDSLTLSLEVAGGFPYAGCVFFVGVTNTGDVPVRFHLGPLGAEASSTCNVSGCALSDIDILAGAPGPDPLSACVVEGGAPSLVGTVYALPPGATVVCPIFIVVLQPAKENATYLIEITPPELQELPLEEEPDDPVVVTSLPPVGQSLPTAAPTKEPEPPTPAPTAGVAGERTPGPNASPTPIAPATGDSLEQRRIVEQAGPAPALLMLAGVALVVAVAWPGRRTG